MTLNKEIKKQIKKVANKKNKDFDSESNSNSESNKEIKKSVKKTTNNKVINKKNNDSSSESSDEEIKKSIKKKSSQTYLIKDDKILLNIYTNEEKLKNICESFENQKIVMNAIFMGKKIELKNCNAFGNILEDIFFPFIKDKIPDFEKGPKQASPDYYGDKKKHFEFEQKTFTIHPGFDIGNFTSYVSQLCETNGLFRKLLCTKYLIFEYIIDKDNVLLIKKFHYLNVWNLVSYNGKYPVSMQVKKNMWYNIRPDGVNNWYDTKKTFHVFVKNIIKCIEKCHHIEDKQQKILNINDQYNVLISKYAL